MRPSYVSGMDDLDSVGEVQRKSDESEIGSARSAIEWLLGILEGVGPARHRGKSRSHPCLCVGASGAMRAAERSMSHPCRGLKLRINTPRRSTNAIPAN